MLLWCRETASWLALRARRRHLLSQWTSPRHAEPLPRLLRLLARSVAAITFDLAGLQAILLRPFPDNFGDAVAQSDCNRPSSRSEAP